jgi:hypothetical protein
MDGASDAAVPERRGRVMIAKKLQREDFIGFLPAC